MKLFCFAFSNERSDSDTPAKPSLRFQKQKELLRHFVPRNNRLE